MTCADYASPATEIIVHFTIAFGAVYVGLRVLLMVLDRRMK